MDMFLICIASVAAGYVMRLAQEIFKQEETEWI